MRLAGLIDIAQEKNYQFIRSPAVAGPNNIPRREHRQRAQRQRPRSQQRPLLSRHAASEPHLRLRSQDRRAEHHRSTPSTTPTRWPATAVQENAIGYAHAQRRSGWCSRSGVDMFRIDATKNIRRAVLNYYDRAVYRASFRKRLTRRTRSTMSLRFGEYLRRQLRRTCRQRVVRKDINPAQLRHGRRQSRYAGFPAVLRDARQPHRQRLHQQLEQHRQRQLRRERRRLATTAARA